MAGGSEVGFPVEQVDDLVEYMDTPIPGSEAKWPR